MNYIFLPSLKHLTLVKIAATFWNQDDVRNEILDDFQHFKVNSKWSDIEQSLMKKVLQLPLPCSLQKESIACIKPIGDLIRYWMHYIGYLCNKRGKLHLSDGDRHAILPNSFCWTPQGTIDQKKTVEVIIKDERIKFITRYKLACYFCLVDDILVLRDKIPEYDRMVFHSENPSLKEDGFDLVNFWSLTRDEDDNWPNSHRRAFSHAAIHGNAVAMKYLLPVLYPDEKEESLISAAVDAVKAGCFLFPVLPEFFCFLLSQMNEEQQMKVFKTVPHALNSLLRWPWQKFFLETVYRVRDIFGTGDNTCYLYVILNKLIQKAVTYTDYDYKMLLGEFWKQIPIVVKTSFPDDKYYDILERLLRNRDRKTIELIFKDVFLVQKEKYSPSAYLIARILREIDDWDSLKLIIEVFVISEDIANKFVEVLNQPEVKKYSKMREDVWNKLLQLLNDHMHKFNTKKPIEEVNDSSDKRSMEEINDTTAKRLCTMSAQSH